MNDGTGIAAPVVDVAWEDPVRPSPSAAPVLAVDGFEGPLDWLLELARAERIDLRKISIRALVEAFAAALERALAASVRVDLSRWGEWLSMAAQLTLLRSRAVSALSKPRSIASAVRVALESTAGVVQPN